MILFEELYALSCIFGLLLDCEGLTIHTYVVNVLFINEFEDSLVRGDLIFFGIEADFFCTIGSTLIALIFNRQYLVGVAGLR